MARFVRAPLARAMRFHGAAAKDGVRRDLFGYEQSSEVGPWNEKISKVPFWNEAGELLVEMNRANCPPDLTTYKAVLRSILRCPSKFEGGVGEGESKFCAMMDLVEEMDKQHRGSETADEECWNIVMEAAIEEGDFRAGRALAACTQVSASLVEANEKVAAAAEREGKSFPAHLTKQPESLFDMEIKAA